MGRLAFDSDRNVIVLFGGYSGVAGNGEPLQDTWEWDGVDWIQKNSSNVPNARSGHHLVYDSLRKVSVLFGGYQQNAQTWEWDGNDWSLSEPIISPPNRSGGAMVYDSTRHEIVLSAGILNDGADGANVWVRTNSQQ